MDHVLSDTVVYLHNGPQRILGQGSSIAKDKATEFYALMSLGHTCRVGVSLLEYTFGLKVAGFWANTLIMNINIWSDFCVATSTFHV